MKTFSRALVRAGATTLPGHYYTSAEIFARESAALFARSWICVGRQEQIPQPGDYFLSEIAGESLIVVRDREGVVRAHFNVCRHRGTRMCTQAEGHFTSSIQCPYHAWTYDLGGALSAARSMEGVAGFERRDYPLVSALVEIRGGFIFVNLDVDTTVHNPVAALAERFASWDMDALRVVRTASYDLPCNWKFVFQNYSECYHCAVIHPQLTKLSPPDSGRNDFSQGPVLGGYMTLREPGGGLTTSGATVRPALGKLGPEELERVYYYTLFPTMAISLHPDYVMTHRIRPVGAARTEVVCEWLFAPSTIALPGFDPSDAFDFWHLTNQQDWRVSELSQLGVASRAYRPGPYSDAEGLLDAFDRHYLAQLTESDAKASAL